VILRAVVAIASGGLMFGLALHAVPSAIQSTASRSVWDSVYTDAQARRGDTVYATLCAQCHGTTLAGIDDAPPLAGKEFLLGWGGSAVGKLFSRIQRTMPQDNSAVLTSQQVADVVAYILHSNNFPSGAVELGWDPAVLDEIRIEGTRPRADSGGIHDSQRGKQ
jgi:mono/diheme cytochrome c family protein